MHLHPLGMTQANWKIIILNRRIIYRRAVLISFPELCLIISGYVREMDVNEREGLWDTNSRIWHPLVI